MRPSATASGSESRSRNWRRRPLLRDPKSDVAARQGKAKVADVRWLLPLTCSFHPICQRMLRVMVGCLLPLPTRHLTARHRDPGRDRRQRSLDCFGPASPIWNHRPLMRRRSAAMTDEQPAREMPQWDEDRAVTAHREAAKAKRSEARGQLLLGSGAALSALMTMSPGRVGAVTHRSARPEWTG